MRSFKLFVKKWYEGFDLRTGDITPISVSVRLFYLPQHIWNIKVVDKIGNSIGTFIKTNVNFSNKEISMMDRICVSVNMQDPLLAEININSKHRSWMQSLNYERIPLHYKWCNIMVHLASYYPMKPTTKYIYRKRGPQSKGLLL